MADNDIDDTTRKFFLESDSPQLEKIYLWARARYAAPWAVFGAVLLRVAASVGPNVQLPGLIGGRASLNLLCAFVSPSGGGKGISDKVARLAWPTPVLELPLGSGEGIAAIFKQPDKPSADEEPVTSAILGVPEIDTLTGLASRQGSILLAQLKSMAMGEQIGQSNASKATSRVVQAHTYRCCLSVGAQPGHTGVLFDDTSGGTPQRFLWFPTTDAAMPDNRSPDPEPLDTKLPSWSTHDDVELQYGPEEIAQTVISAHLARQRGQADALDGHAMLTRCKVAAVLAVMHSRSVVSEWDWQRSADVMAVSDRTREWIVTEAKRAARAKVHDRAVLRAVGDAIYDDRVLEGVKRSIVRMLDRDGEQAGNELRSRLGKREKRDLFDQAVALLEQDGIVVRETVERGTRFRIAVGQGDQLGQGPNRQVSEGDPVGHPDQSDNVTDLDTRRSHEADPPKLTAREWFEKHIADLQAAGHTTAKSVAVLEAGEAAGFTKNNLRQAVSAHPDVKLISRKGGGATWSIEPGKQVPEYVGAPQWLDDFLDRQTEATVLPEDVRIAGEAAGHPWHSVRRAAGMSSRIESIPAHGHAKNDRLWKIQPAIESETSA